jgi:hypothetical protein
MVNQDVSLLVEQRDQDRPPCRASFRRAKITVKGAPDGASATLDTDLPRQDPGTYQEDEVECSVRTMLADGT